MSDFYGHKLIQIEAMGKRVWLANHVGPALGYTDPSGLVKSIMHDWRDEFEEGRDFLWAKGDDAQAIAKAASLPHPDARRSLMLLTESGINLACLKTTKQRGKDLRRWLAGDHLPEVARKGQIPAEVAAGVPSMEAPAQSPVLATANDPVLGALQSLATIRQQQLAEAEARRVLEGRVAALEARALPPTATPAQPAPRPFRPTLFPDEPTPSAEQFRALPPTILQTVLNKHMQERMAEEVSPRSDAYGMKIQARWQQLYIAFRDRYGLNAGKEAERLTRERGRKHERLDAIAAAQKLPELLTLALEMWPAPRDRRVA